MADASGKVESLWVPESWGRESFATLGAMSQVTQQVRLGTSIINIYSRTPGTVAMGATTLDMLSGSRALIGLGTSTEAIVENWHGVRFEKPIDRMREFVECLRMMNSGEHVVYDGGIFKIKNFKLLHRPERKRIPILVAAVNEKMISLATQIADGTLLYLRPLEELKKTVHAIKNSTRDRDFEIACSLIFAVSEDNPDEARTRAAKTLAFYVAVGKYYRTFLSTNGFESECSAIHGAYFKDGLDEAARCVTKRMLDALAVCGSREECAVSLAAFASSGITLPILQFNPVGGTESSFRELLSTIQD